MLVVNIDIWPFGYEEDRRHVGRIFIANTLRKDGAGAHIYKARLLRDGDVPIRMRDDDAEFAHFREDGAEVCVAKAIEAINSKEDNEK